MGRFLPLLLTISLCCIQTPLVVSGEPNCPCCGCSCSKDCLVPVTIKVPTMVTVQRMKSILVTKTEEREQTYTVFKRVPVKKKYYKECCYLDDQVKTKMIEKKRCQLVKNDATVKFEAKIPLTEYQYHYPPCQCQDCNDPAAQDACNDASCPCKVCKVTRLGVEERTAQCERPDVIFHKEKCEIDYCVKVPKRDKQVCMEETVYELVPIEKTRKVTVCVPEYIKVPHEVEVCMMVPKTIWCCPKCCKGKKHCKKH